MTEKRDFDAAAAGWDEEPRRVKLSSEIAAAIRSAVTLSPEWQAMDFGCGTGLVTVQLAPNLGRIVGVDSSEGMLAQLEQKIERLGLTNVRTAPAERILTAPAPDQFHLITSAMTLHHVEQLPPLLATFHSLLQPGGHVALADLESEDGSFHDDPTGVFHHGFSSQQLTSLLAAAGFRSITVQRVTEIAKGERRFPVLLVTAVK